MSQKLLQDKIDGNGHKPLAGFASIFQRTISLQIFHSHGRRFEDSGPLGSAFGRRASEGKDTERDRQRATEKFFHKLRLELRAAFRPFNGQ
ncbi:Uncharacterised protein [Candidatus Gugararchaeum adminiculabundum]|nr:Uncharacterised protein [Candidatus Gugararchaeum adminiculabundum]